MPFPIFSDSGLIFLYFFLFFLATAAFCFFVSGKRERQRQTDRRTDREKKKDRDTQRKGGKESARLYHDSQLVGAIRSLMETIGMRHNPIHPHLYVFLSSNRRHLYPQIGLL